MNSGANVTKGHTRSPNCRCASCMATCCCCASSTPSASQPTGMDLKTIFKVADTALYEAKRRGRNHYVLAAAAIDLSVHGASA